MYQTLIKPAFIDVKNFILDTLFPVSCLSCGEEGAFVCAICKASLVKLEHQRCIACQKPTPFGLTHQLCQTAYGADALISFYDYHDEKVAKIIIQGKYSFLPGAYKLLGKIIAEKIKTDHGHLLTTTPYTLTPIPLHSSRKRWRGFNQAEVLCRSLSEQLNLPMAALLIRRKITKTQKDLKRDQRIKNVDSAFVLSPAFLNLKSQILNHNFILVDDVTTTGATLREAAKILKRGGAKKVICLTIARD